MPTVVLERPPSTHEAPTSAPREASPSTGSAGRPPWHRDGRGGGGRGPRGRSEAWSVLVAALITAAIGALFTFLGILTQIWANMAGTQLPGA
jgi:hypothetical protein